jgi:phosphonoacetate hydrolase
MMDTYWSQLDAQGAILGMTADHGMNAKFNDAGEPDVIYLQDVLDDMLGVDKARVILPITDPYVVHHGALGSFATAYLSEGASANNVVEKLADLEGVEAAYTNIDGCEKYELPNDTMGDIIVVSTTNKVIGTSPDRHDLTQLKEPLRSHGGACDQQVPVILSKPVTGVAANHRLRNFDVFNLALNHTV